MKDTVEKSVIEATSFSRRQSEDGLESDISAAACPQQDSCDQSNFKGGNELKLAILA